MCHEGDILAEPVVEVAGLPAVDSIDVHVGDGVEVIPLSQAFAIFVPRAFALIGRVGGSPDKRSVGERSGRFAHGVPPVLGVVF